MSNIQWLINKSTLDNIGDAIRAKKGTSSPIDVPDLADEIESISGIIPTGTININSNGTHDVTQYASASVAVPQANIQSTKTVTENGTVLPDSGYDALAQVIVNVSGGGGSSKFANGSITLTAGLTDPVTVEHGLGVVPNCILYVTVTNVGGSTEYRKGGWHFDNFLGYSGLNNVAFATMYNTWRGNYINVNPVDNVDEDFFDMLPGSTGFPPGGCTMYWFALYIDTTQ